MDELKGKFKTLLAKASNKQKQGFEGQGHRLGTAEEHGVKPKVQGQAVVSASASGNTSSSSSRVQRPQHAQPVAGAQQHPPRPSSSPAPPPAGVHDLKPATEFDPFTAVIGSGAALSAGLASPPAAAAAPAPPAASRMPDRTRLPPAAASTQPPQQQQQQQQALAPVTVEQLDEMHHCLALIASQSEAAAGTMQVLGKLLGNLAASPQEAKFRHIRLSNPRIHQAVVQVAGGLELLEACGFQVHQPPAADAAGAAAAGGDRDAGDDEGGFAVFLDDSQLSLVQAGLQQLQEAMPAALAAAPQQQQHQQQLAAAAAAPPPPSALAAATTAAATSSPVAPAARAAAPQATLPPANSVARDTQVLLPAVPDTNVPDWFFERTPADVKAEYATMLRRRATGEVFASKTWKDAQLGRQPGQARPTTALVRVRFPEGVCLQGRFHVSEPLTALFSWVTDSLRHAGITFELVGPDRRPLTPAGTIGTAQLAPAALVSFRPLGDLAAAGGYQLRDEQGRVASFLHDQLLVRARAD